MGKEKVAMKSKRYTRALMTDGGVEIITYVVPTWVNCQLSREGLCGSAARPES